MKKKFLLPLILAAIFATSAKSEIKLPAIMGDHMVLQQQTKANLWGWADSNKTVTIRCSWDKKSYTTKADGNGRWLQSVETPAAGGPYEITISDGKELSIKDVLIGEVWLCSGQSNMEMPVSGFGQGQFVEHSQKYITKANPSRNLRMAQLERDFSTTPREDCKTKWMTNNPESVDMISATAYFFADYLQNELNIPVGIIVTCWGGASIETWMSEEALKKAIPDVDMSVLNDSEKYKNEPNHFPNLLYNAMIMPIKNYTLKGAIWYQGESNIGEDKNKGIHSYKQYPALQKAMVENWRELFNNPEMPYYFIQIAPYAYSGSNNIESAYQREAQAKSMSEISNSGMVVTIDIGEERCIHPAKKIEVGERLGYWALAKTYNFPIKYKSPSYTTMEKKDNVIVVNFDECNKGLHNGAGKTAEIVGFEIAGEDKVFHPAKAKLLSSKNSQAVEVSSTEVSNPVAVRYCFKNYQPGYLCNAMGLPVSPFRTDNW